MQEAFVTKKPTKKQPSLTLFLLLFQQYTEKKYVDLWLIMNNSNHKWLITINYYYFYIIKINETNTPHKHTQQRSWFSLV